MRRSPRRRRSGRLAERAEAPAGLTLGTAGHIDHGKTRLVAALTGTDTDRLAEERRRGISIELGFAELELPGGGSVGIVDVPGHERLVRTMVAGAGGIDMFLLVVAADDGVMPQTVEHVEVLRALGVERGLVAVTKIDLVDAGTVALARGEILTLLPEAALVEVSAERGDGVERLRSKIAELAAAIAAEQAEASGWPPAGGLLHVDRSFTIAGAGTVVTGTAGGDGFAAGEEVAILPAGQRARLRTIQIHGRETAAVGRGRRAALNLAGVGREEVPRGSVVSAAEAGPEPSYRLDVLLLGDAAERPPSGRIQVHHGTRDSAARVVPLGAALAQLRLEAPLVARARDRLVLRAIAPPGTIGGAEVLDPDPRRHGPGPDADRLWLLHEGDPGEIVVATVAAGAEVATDASAWDADSPFAWALPRFPRRRWEDTVDELLAAGRLADRHGLLAIPEVAAERTAPEQAETDRTDVVLLAMVAADGVEPRPPQTLAGELGLSRSEAVGRLDRLAGAGHLVRVSAEVYYPPRRLAELEGVALGLAREHGSVGLAGLRDRLRTSRKYSQAILEHLDRTGQTVRRGDEHLPRPSAPPQ
jgi:selenocysteine-specific elongation factor